MRVPFDLEPHGFHLNTLSLEELKKGLTFYCQYGVLKCFKKLEKLEQVLSDELAVV